jgi:hypothetical protein
MSTFSEITTNVIEGVTSLQDYYLKLAARIEALESENADKTEHLDAAHNKNQSLVREIRNVRKENKKLRRRPTGMKVSGSVHVQETRQPSPIRKNNNHRNASPQRTKPQQTRTQPTTRPDNIPFDMAGFPFDKITPDIAEALILILQQVK